MMRGDSCKVVVLEISLATTVVVVMFVFLFAVKTPWLLEARYTTKGVVGNASQTYFCMEQGGTPLSFWHDIPVYPGAVPWGGTVVNMVVEIPRGTTEKKEVVKDALLNSLQWDGRQREPYPYIYGMIPQTWEDPSHIDPDTKFPGDNDPLDCIVVGLENAKNGEVKTVKILGIYAMIDDKDVTDWKTLAIDNFDPYASLITDGVSLEKFYPGILKVVVDYLKSRGNPKFAYGGQLLDAAKAASVIRRMHDSWRMLNARLAAQWGISLVNTRLNNNETISWEAARQIIAQSRN